jgi:hypothetical protein
MSPLYGMLTRMSRYPLQTVTLPIVIDSTKFFRSRGERPKPPDGWATIFYGQHGEKHTAVREITPSDVEKWRPKIFSRNEFSLYLAADKIRRAYEGNDELVFRRWFEEISPWLFGQKCQTVVPSGDPKWKVQVRYAYSRLMSMGLQQARTVMWLSDKEQCFRPGIYCPDWKTAAFVTLFNGGLRVCPQCGSTYVPKKPNQGYCRAAHGVAYRTARSRWKIKQQSTRKRARGGSV